jgi:hypothetical protein
MKYARIVNNEVFETFTPPTGVGISECFTSELVAQFIECPENVEQHWTYDGSTFTEPVVVVRELPADQVIIVAE